MAARFPGLIIANVMFTDLKLGRGADATVYAVEWNGTVCAAKRLHEILLEDESPGGADKLISNFEAECLTWSKLRHPGVVQFLGVYLERNSLLPVLVMEKMGTSLRKYLENHSKDELPLHLKVFVLRQVTQALAYLHNQNPPLVHHDLSTNNVLLSVVSFVTKISDFGMSRAINPSALTRKSSIKGTLAFMAPEALQKVPKYDTKLDVFSFGNVVISTLTHEWPDPEAPTKYEGGQLIALSELQRREHCTELFTAQEKLLFLPIVRQCLENRPDQRPSSVTLVQELRRIESTFPRGVHVGAPVEQLRQQLSAKEEECRQKEVVIRENDRALREKNEVIREKEIAIREKEMVIRENDRALREKNEVIREKEKVIREKEAELQCLRKERDNERQGRVRATPGLGEQFAVVQKVSSPPRDWRELGQCQKVIKHSSMGSWYSAVAVNSEGQLAVTDNLNRCVHLLSKEGALVRSIGEGGLGGFLPGVAYDLKGNVWVADCFNNKVVKLSQNGRLLQTIHHARGNSLSRPYGLSVSPEGLIYICDGGNHRVTVCDKEGKFLFAFGSKGSGPGCFNSHYDLTFGSDGLVYVTDVGNNRVCVWSKDGTFQRDFKLEYPPWYIAATSDNHLVITLHRSDTVIVYTLDGKLVHTFGGRGSAPEKFSGPLGVCVDSDGLVYVVDEGNKQVQVF